MIFSSFKNLKAEILCKNMKTFYLKVNVLKKAHLKSLKRQKFLIFY